MEKKYKLNEANNIKKNLNELVTYGGEIKRQDILDAEEISFNKFPPTSIVYDEYGFINDKEKSKIK